MSEDYPSNSRNPTKQPRPDKLEEKNVERVVKGDVVRRKRPLNKRMREVFVGEDDARNVWGHVFLDVMVPAVKDMVADAVSTGVERMLFGDSRSPSRRGRQRSPYGQHNYTPYSSHYASTRPVAREDPRTMSRRGRTAHDFDEIILDSRAEAEEVIDGLMNLIAQYDIAQVSDLYTLVGIQPSFTDDKYGWTDLRGASVTRVRSGYLLDLPRPEVLER